VDLSQKYEANATAIRQRVHREKWVKPDKEQEVEPMTNSKPLNIEALATSMSVGTCNSSPATGAMVPGAGSGSLSMGDGTGDIAQGASPEEISNYVEFMVRDVIDTLPSIRRLPAPKTRKSIMEHEKLVGIHLDRAQWVLGVFKKGVEGTGSVINIHALAHAGTRA